jgi:hypothetical protein
VDLPLDDAQLGEFEWIEEGKQYREWLVPAALLNENATIVVSEIDEDELLGLQILQQHDKATAVESAHSRLRQLAPCRPGSAK